MEMIELEQLPEKPHLYFTRKMKADTNESTEHLKRDIQSVHVLRESENVRFDVDPDTC